MPFTSHFYCHFEGEEKGIYDRGNGGGSSTVTLIYLFHY